MCILACFFLRGRSFLTAPNDFEAALGPSWPCFTSHKAVRRHFGLIVGKLGRRETPLRIAFYCPLGDPASRGVFGPFLGCLFGAKKRPKKDPQTGPTNASKKDDCQRQKRPKNGAKIDEKTTPNNMLEKRHAKGRGTAKKQVLGAPCKLKMGISLGRGYKNEQWQLTCSRSLSAHKNSHF